MLRSISLSLIATACTGAGSPAPIANHPACAGSTIRDVDFQNRTYEIAGESVSVKNGEFVRSPGADGGDRGFVEVQPPVYGDVDGDGREDAIVVVTNYDGGTGRLDEARVFTMACDHAIERATIPGGDRADGGLVAVAVESGGVRVERNLQIDGDADCCASQTMIEHWQWKDGELSLPQAKDLKDQD